jgi:uncharacterized protein YxeA
MKKVLYFIIALLAIIPAAVAELFRRNLIWGCC